MTTLDVDLFARCFLLVFAQLYVGGMLALSVPPFHDIERGFYKSSGGIFIGSGLLSLIGRFALIARPPSSSPGIGVAQAFDLVLLSVSLLAACTYLHSLWGENGRRRARAYAASLLSGMAALVASTYSFGLNLGISFEAILFPLNVLSSAFVLGGVCGGMLLGHWYLIDSGLSLDPFFRLFRFFAWSLAAQSAGLVLSLLAALLMGHGDTTAALQLLWGEYAALFGARLLVSPLGTAVLAWMVWKTLQIPQTMAATGLLYVAILSALVGEFMGHFLLFRTGLPF